MAKTGACLAEERLRAPLVPLDLASMGHEVDAGRLIVAVPSRTPGLLPPKAPWYRGVLPPTPPYTACQDSMQEEKWGILERFRIRPGHEGIVEKDHPGLYAAQMRLKGELLPKGAHVLGPFRLEDETGTWWTVLWQFPDRKSATTLRSIVDDESWSTHVETRLLEGPKFDPMQLLPGF